MKELGFYYVLLMFIANMLGLFFFKNKKGIIIINAFQKIIDQWNRKSNKIWVDKGSEFDSLEP